MSKQAALQAAGQMPEMERATSGRFANKRGRKKNVAELARKILEQPAHLRMLKAQARAGVGTADGMLPPATHKILLEYAYGAPLKNKDAEDDAMKKLELLREEAQRFLKENPDQARVIDISVQRAMSRGLPASRGEDDKPGA